MEEDRDFVVLNTFQPLMCPSSLFNSIKITPVPQKHIDRRIRVSIPSIQYLSTLKLNEIKCNRTKI